MNLFFQAFEFILVIVIFSVYNSGDQQPDFVLIPYIAFISSIVSLCICICLIVLTFFSNRRVLSPNIAKNEEKFAIIEENNRKTLIEIGNENVYMKSNGDDPLSATDRKRNSLSALKESHENKLPITVSVFKNGHNRKNSIEQMKKRININTDMEAMFKNMKSDDPVVITYDNNKYSEDDRINMNNIVISEKGKYNK